MRHLWLRQVDTAALRGCSIGMQDPDDLAATNAAAPLTGRTIVLFEDDELVRRATERLLQRLGAEIVVGMSSSQAMESLRAAGTAPNWVVADYWFTRQEDGLAATKAVRSAFGPSVKGLIVTGDGSSVIADAVEEAGFLLLRKPVNIDHFIAALVDDN